MTFFYLSYFFGPVGEYGFTRYYLSPDQLFLPLLLILIHSATATLCYSLSDFESQASTSIRKRSMHCSSQSSSIKYENVLRSSPQPTTFNNCVNLIHFCDASPITFGGCRYER